MDSAKTKEKHNPLVSLATICSLLQINKDMFGSVYPALEELKQPLSEEQLNVLRNQLKAEEPKPSPQTRFNYAWGLIKSSSQIGRAHV